MLTNNKDLLQSINQVITESNISKLNLEAGKYYLISYDKNNNSLSLNQNIKDCIYIKKIQFHSTEQAKEELINHNIFERLLMNDNPNLNLEFFSNKQLRMIECGSFRDIDIDVFAKPIYDPYQMNLIIDGLVDKYDISLYNNPEFEFERMYAIHYGLKMKIDATIYANPEFNLEQMEQCIAGLLDHIDVSTYAKAEFDAEQMLEIRIGIEKGLDVSKYAKENISPMKMKDIRLKLEYSGYKTSELRKGRRRK